MNDKAGCKMAGNGRRLWTACGVALAVVYGVGGVEAQEPTGPSSGVRFRFRPADEPRLYAPQEQPPAAYGEPSLGAPTFAQPNFEPPAHGQPIYHQPPAFGQAVSQPGGFGQGEREIRCPSLEEVQAKMRPVTTVTPNIAHKPGLPVPDCSYEFFQAQGVHPALETHRGWGESTFNWKASGACHRPLYFEDVPAERYGHTHGKLLQPIASGARFFATIPALPYKMTIDHPRDCVYTLGYYRPGSKAPHLRQLPPFNAKAAAVEVGVIAGLILLIP